jgi:hypothetical protein
MYLFLSRKYKPHIADMKRTNKHYALMLRVRTDHTYGKNLKAFTGNPFFVNASLISSSETEGLKIQIYGHMNI